MVKVIFLENIEDNKVGDIKEVSEGYARNYLLRRGKAEIATEEKLKEVEARLSKIKKEEAENVKKAKELADKINKLNLVMTEEVNEEGHLYGSVTNREVADALEAKKIEIDPANIEVIEPIKVVGKHEITVKVGHGVETILHIEIKRGE
jgi:large subunit ribosomal protein L9